MFVPRKSGMSMANGKITGGRYLIARELGPSNGDYGIQISAYRKTGRAIQPSPYSPQKTPVDEVEQYLPETFNETSSLFVTIVASQDQYDFKLNLDDSGRQ